MPASSDAVRRRFQRQRRASTKPEMLIRRKLHRRGWRYRVDTAPLATYRRRRADIVFTRLRVAVFVDGCFWHSCPDHATRPKANAEWWRAKLQANVERDRDTDARLREAGWEVVRIWEHEPAEDAVERIERILIARRDQSSSGAT
ncbi:very short patch repair endonuclease [Egicoccus sp. AB-alg2]|uniref:very short patch repair endonuclease n=1 Tax=Egicoccus sp. AB-alg2 TaxID=3242693 RepID=UPI00359D2ABB